MTGRIEDGWHSPMLCAMIAVSTRRWAMTTQQGRGRRLTPDEALHAEAESIAVPNCDWLGMTIEGLLDATTALAPPSPAPQQGRPRRGPAAGSVTAGQA